MIRRAGIRELVTFLGVSRPLVALLVTAAVLAGLAEAAVLSLIAYTAAVLSEPGAASVPLEIGGRTLADLTVPTVLAVAFALVVLRLGLQEISAIIPARLNADLQLRVRDELWGSFLRASWDVQSQDQEGGSRTG